MSVIIGFIILFGIVICAAVGSIAFEAGERKGLYDGARDTMREAVRRGFAKHNVETEEYEWEESNGKS